ncbi:hypothetical protein EDEG_01341 [Edhazardia aedis USNM 41457]|uniref:PH domain-containing protein n=1 Tax=Edhazardia aedis (strain USNM 41457) TaxID=1003232 RepID=J9D9M4_EDHAE|nr:hypothetical protein EDEG_01341 [Edhazardia aedis USNM 41457]|eukprot:EJW04471.1 hypothetical protein EDEG_01341 [Edhazardia aedis USNM 41457]
MKEDEIVEITISPKFPRNKDRNEIKISVSPAVAESVEKDKDDPYFDISMEKKNLSQCSAVSEIKDLLKQEVNIAVPSIDVLVDNIIIDNDQKTNSHDESKHSIYEKSINGSNERKSADNYSKLKTSNIYTSAEINNNDLYKDRRVVTNSSSTTESTQNYLRNIVDNSDTIAEKNKKLSKSDKEQPENHNINREKLSESMCDISFESYKSSNQSFYTAKSEIKNQENISNLFNEISESSQSSFCREFKLISMDDVKIFDRNVIFIENYNAYSVVPTKYYQIDKYTIPETYTLEDGIINILNPREQHTSDNGKNSEKNSTKSNSFNNSDLNLSDIEFYSLSSENISSYNFKLSEKSKSNIEYKKGSGLFQIVKTDGKSYILSKIDTNFIVNRDNVNVSKSTGLEYNTCITRSNDLQNLSDSCLRKKLQECSCGNCVNSTMKRCGKTSNRLESINASDKKIRKFYTSSGIDNSNITGSSESKNSNLTTILESKDIFSSSKTISKSEKIVSDVSSLRPSINIQKAEETTHSEDSAKIDHIKLSSYNNNSAIKNIIVPVEEGCLQKTEIYDDLSTYNVLSEIERGIVKLNIDDKNKSNSEQSLTNQSANNTKDLVYQNDSNIEKKNLNQNNLNSSKTLSNRENVILDSSLIDTQSIKSTESIHSYKSTKSEQSIKSSTSSANNLQNENNHIVELDLVENGFTDDKERVSLNEYCFAYGHNQNAHPNISDLMKNSDTSKDSANSITQPCKCDANHNCNSTLKFENSHDFIINDNSSKSTNSITQIDNQFPESENKNMSKNVFEQKDIKLEGENARSENNEVNISKAVNDQFSELCEKKNDSENDLRRSIQKESSSSSAHENTNQNILQSDYIKKIMRERKQNMKINKYIVEDSLIHNHHFEEINPVISNDDISSYITSNLNTNTNGEEIENNESPISSETKKNQAEEIFKEAQSRVNMNQANNTNNTNIPLGKVKRFVLAKKTKTVFIDHTNSISDLHSDILMGQIKKLSKRYTWKSNWFKLQDTSFICYNNKLNKMPIGKVPNTSEGEIKYPLDSEHYLTTKFKIDLKNAQIFLVLEPFKGNVFFSFKNTLFNCASPKMVCIDDLVLVNASIVDNSYRIHMKNPSKNIVQYTVSSLEICFKQNDLKYFLSFDNLTGFLKWNIAFELRTGKLQWPVN